MASTRLLVHAPQPSQYHVTKYVGIRGQGDCCKLGYCFITPLMKLELVYSVQSTLGAH